MELPWRLNEESYSNIPPGAYLGTTKSSPTLGWTIELEGTGPRKAILIHRGNYPIDTHGCILIGLGRSSGQQPINVPSADDSDKLVKDSHSGIGPEVPVITDSGKAIERLKDLLQSYHTSKIELIIID
jgi:Family of unknown function (DUF5675)